MKYGCLCLVHGRHSTNVTVLLNRGKSSNMRTRKTSEQKGMEREEYPGRKPIFHFNWPHKGYSKCFSTLLFWSITFIWVCTFWYVCETFSLADLYSYHKCKPIKWHIKGNCRMVALVRRQMSGSGWGRGGGADRPLISCLQDQSRTHLSQQPFEVKQQCGEELQNEFSANRRRFVLFKGKYTLQGIRVFTSCQVKRAWILYFQIQMNQLDL